MVRMQTRHRKNGARTLLLILVFATAAVNASQSLVLCLGHDGHVAVEPAGHHHCAGTRPYAADPADPHSHIADDHCQPCTDIPISLWVRGEPAGSRATESGVSTHAAVFSLPRPADGPSILPELSGSPPPICSPLSLRAIVLQV
jgi:hypothetical protein